MQLLCLLLKDALYNKIEDPKALSERLESIIDSINSAQINELQPLQKVQIQQIHEQKKTQRK